MKSAATLLNEARQLLDTLAGRVESDLPDDYLSKRVRTALDDTWIFLEDTEDMKDD